MQSSALPTRPVPSDYEGVDDADLQRYEPVDRLGYGPAGYHGNLARRIASFPAE